MDRHHGRWLAAVVAATLALHAPATAHAQDGGARSLFAQGAGDRALAMGGAFGAIADDPSALLWNPGGLARLERLGLEVGQASYFAEGIGESYLVAALPSWRWGTTAVAFRHIGTDGIEQRDDRNIVVGDPLSDSQSEFVLGYARPMSEAWSLGGSFRARRQSLAGYAAGGFGADVGVLASPGTLLGRNDSWVSDLRVGFAISNLLRPTLRLDREAVSDPTAVRAGVAWRRMVAGMRTLTVAMDLEQPAGLGAKLHTGAELQLLPQVAMRAGFDGSTLTAGTGIRWHDVGFDYTYENRSLESVHRVGLNVAFGSSVSDLRAAAERKDEQELQARLNDAFARRQSEQVDSLVARATAQHDAGATDEALELLATALAIDPARADATTLAAACHAERGAKLEAAGDYPGAAIAFGRALTIAPADTAASAGKRRCEARSDSLAARTEETRAAFARALDAFGADDLGTAKRGFVHVLSLVPDDAEAQRMLQRTNDAIARRTQALQRDAARALEAGRTDDAAEIADQLDALDGGAAGTLRTSISRTRAEATARASRTASARPAPVAAPTPRMSARELDLLFRRGMDAMQQRRPDDAVRYWELVWSASPGYGRVRDYLKREYLTRGMDAFAAGRLDEASDYWRRALRVDPNDARAAGYLERAQKQQARTREILGSDN